MPNQHHLNANLRRTHYSTDGTKHRDPNSQSDAFQPNSNIYPSTSQSDRKANPGTNTNANTTSDASAYVHTCANCNPCTNTHSNGNSHSSSDSIPDSSTDQTTVAVNSNTDPHA